MSGVIAGHRAPDDSRIDFIGGEIMHHRRGRGIDAGVDDQDPRLIGRNNDFWCLATQPRLDPRQEFRQGPHIDRLLRE
jgi:hypothetical protein